MLHRRGRRSWQRSPSRSRQVRRPPIAERATDAPGSPVLLIEVDAMAPPGCVGGGASAGVVWQGKGGATPPPTLAQDMKSNADAAAAGIDGGCRPTSVAHEGGGGPVIMPSNMPPPAPLGMAEPCPLPLRGFVGSAALHISASTSESARKLKCSSPAISSMRVASGPLGSTYGLAVAPLTPRSRDHFGGPLATSASEL